MDADPGVETYGSRGQQGCHNTSETTLLLRWSGHVQGICQAQVATAANARLQRIREEAQGEAGRADSRAATTTEPEEEEDEWTAMMQGATALHTVQGGLSTFALSYNP